MTFPTDTIVATIALLLMGVGVLTLLSGGLAVVGRKRQSYFRSSRRRSLDGFQIMAVGLMLILGGAFISAFGRPAFELIFTPTITPTPSNTPTPRPTATQTPTITPTRTITPTPSNTPEGGIPTPTLTPSGVPTLPPIELPEGTLTITPPPDGLIGNVRVGRLNNCASNDGVAESFGPEAKTLYALFDYDGWLAGARWNYVWTLNGEVIYVWTGLWDGSSGGCGFADFDNGGADWAPGLYSVQIFLGDRFVGGAVFEVR